MVISLFDQACSVFLPFLFCLVIIVPNLSNYTIPVYSDKLKILNDNAMSTCFEYSRSRVQMISAISSGLF